MEEHKVDLSSHFRVSQKQNQSRARLNQSTPSLTSRKSLKSSRRNQSTPVMTKRKGTKSSRSHQSTPVVANRRTIKQISPTTTAPVLMTNRRTIRSPKEDNDLNSLISIMSKSTNTQRIGPRTKSRRSKSTGEINNKGSSSNPSSKKKKIVNTIPTITDADATTNTARRRQSTLTSSTKQKQQKSILSNKRNSTDGNHSKKSVLTTTRTTTKTTNSSGIEKRHSKSASPTLDKKNGIRETAKSSGHTTPTTPTKHSISRNTHRRRIDLERRRYTLETICNGHKFE